MVQKRRLLKEERSSVFYPPPASESNIRFLKRCAAVSGDMIKLKGDDFFYIRMKEIGISNHTMLPKKVVTMDGMLWVKNPYSDRIQHIGQQEKNYDFCYFLPTVTISENRFMALGDNRDNSYDSRYWGSVLYENIIAKADRVLASFDVDKWTVRSDRFMKVLR